MNHVFIAKSRSLIRLARLLATVFGLVALSGLPVDAQIGAFESPSRETDACTRVMLEKTLWWSQNSYWQEADRLLRIINPFSKEKNVLSFDVRGKFRAEDSLGQVPVAMIPVESEKGQSQRFLAFLSETEGQWVDTVSGITTPVSLESLAAGSGYKVVSNYQRTVASSFNPLFGDVFLGYGIIRPSDSNSDSNYFYAFYAQWISNSQTIATQHVRTMPAATELYYRLGYQYVCSQLGSVYYIVLDQFPSLWKFDLTTRTASEVTGFPGFDKSLPLFEQRIVGDSYEAVFGAVENFDGLLSGLLCYDGLLYTIYRPSSSGDQWHALQMREANGAITDVREIAIPSHAKHLRIVPTTDRWLILEQGTVRFADQQPRQALETMLLIPRQSLVSRDSPLRSPGGGSRTCAGARETDYTLLWPDAR